METPYTSVPLKSILLVSPGTGIVKTETAPVFPVAGEAAKSSTEMEQQQAKEKRAKKAISDIIQEIKDGKVPPKPGKLYDNVVLLCSLLFSL